MQQHTTRRPQLEPAGGAVAQSMTAVQCRAVQCSIVPASTEITSAVQKYSGVKCSTCPGKCNLGDTRELEANKLSCDVM